MIPVEARTTVREAESRLQEKPTRGAKLFLSFLKDCESGFAANGRASGMSNRS